MNYCFCCFCILLVYFAIIFISFFYSTFPSLTIVFRLLPFSFLFSINLVFSIHLYCHTQPIHTYIDPYIPTIHCNDLICVQHVARHCDYFSFVSECLFRCCLLLFFFLLRCQTPPTHHNSCSPFVFALEFIMHNHNVSVCVCVFQSKKQLSPF